MTTGTATLTWFARHELTLAWRDWASLMSGGKTAREYAATAFTLGFIVLLHGLAYALLQPIITGSIAITSQSLVLITAMLLATFSMMLSQAIEQVTRAFYARADLDLILSSPAAAHHLFAVRIASIAVAGTVMTSLLAAPLINTAAYLGGVGILSAYLVLAAMSMMATAISVVTAVALFKSIGPKRTRLVAQIVAAVVGAALLIGLQIVAIMSNGDLSRMTVLRSAAMMKLAPDTSSLVWIPAKAVIGQPFAVVTMFALGVAALAAVIARHAGQFGHHAVVASGTAETEVARAGTTRGFRGRSMAQALRAKEWLLLRRDPWLASQTLMQVLYLLPPALLLWRDMGPDKHVDTILVPVLVMAFGQLAGGLAWLAISGEDAPELVATAPLKPAAVMRAKIEAVLAVIGFVAAPIVIALAFVAVQSAAIALFGIMAAGCSAIAIQIWFKSTAKRSQFRRRQTASKSATFAEAFSSIFWAAAAGFAVTDYWIPATLFAVMALVALSTARWMSPRA
ncbi:MAG: permease [Hyphomicrobium sp.]|nr:permease [Hyphomicrobium sp.]